MRVTTNITVPVSAGLLHEVTDYYDALTAYRRGELRPIITAFTRAAGYAVMEDKGQARRSYRYAADLFRKAAR